MSIDAHILLVPKQGSDRETLHAHLTSVQSLVTWLGDGSVAIFTGVRYREFAQADAERRVHLAFAHIPAAAFPALEPYAVAFPDLVELDADDTLASILNLEEAVQIDFKDFVPGDARLAAAAESEVDAMMKQVDVILAYTRYQSQDAAFAADILALAKAGDIPGLIARTRAVPELAPLVEQLREAGLFESLVHAIPRSWG